jgi:orotate phosphoribosyltransferase
VNSDQALDEFRSAGALLEGHFVLTSGLHSPIYLQCARVMMDARRGERLCAALADRVREQLGGDSFDVVISPAMGGVVVGYEMGRQLGVKALFVERVDGKFAVRRGFSIAVGARVLVVEDVVTTGKSSRECINCIKEVGGRVVGEAALVDRSNGAVELGVPLVSLVSIDAPAYAADELPESLAARPAVKPGSRHLR